MSEESTNGILHEGRQDRSAARGERNHTVAERVLHALRLALRLGERPVKRLRLCESLTLGDRRFVAVVEFEQRRFLLGGTGQSLVLLADLDRTDVPVGEAQR